MVPSSGKGGFPVPMNLPEFVGKYGKRRITLDDLEALATILEQQNKRSEKLGPRQG